MNRDRSCHIKYWLIPLLLISASPLHSQAGDRPGEVHHRNQCRLAAQVMETGHPATKKAWARGYISACADQGPAVLAKLWRSVAGDSAEVWYLERASKRIRDRRLYEQLQSTALDRTRPDLVRVGALLVLSKYVDPHSAVWFSDLRPPHGAVLRIPVITSWSTAGGQSNGSVALDGSTARPVLELLEQIAAQRVTESRAVWYAAAVLAKRVKFDIEAGRAR